MYYANSERYMFYLPGRLRVCVKDLHCNREFADKINHCLEGIMGIKKAIANPYTGNVLVFFSEELCTISFIEGLINKAKGELDSTSSEQEHNYNCFRFKKNNLDIESIRNIKRVYSKLTPIVVIASTLFFFASGNYLLPLSIFLLSNPFMIYLSTLITLSTVTENASVNNIIINNPSKLDICSKIDFIVFDNTSLLTEALYKVTDIIPSGRNSKNKILLIAASCGQNNEDAISMTLVEAAASRKLQLKKVSNYNVCLEKGISCAIDNNEVQIGNKNQFGALSHEKNFFSSNHKTDERKLKHLGQYPIFVAYNQKIIGIISLECTINKNCVEAIEAMREAGIENIKIITEEDEEIVKNIAHSAGIESYEANVQPEGKIKSMVELNAQGRKIALISKGVNCCSQIQISDVAIIFSNTNVDLKHECWDFTITNNDLSLIPKIIELSKYTKEVIWQNCIISSGLDAIGMILLLTKAITPYSALLYKFANSIIVLLNARKPVNYRFNNLVSR